MEALFEGRLVVESGCLVLTDGVGEYTPLWPLDVDIEVDDEDLVVDGHRVGERLKVGGGIVSAETNGEYGNVVWVAKRLCEERDVWVVAP